MANRKSDNPKTGKNSSTTVRAMVKLRADYANDEKAHRKRVRESICRAYELGLKMKRDNRQWESFITQDWTGITGGPPTTKQRQDAVRFALKFMVGAGEEAQKDASFYYRAIKSFAERRISPDKLKVQLEKTPLKNLAEQQARSKKKATAQASDDPMPTPPSGQKKGPLRVSLSKSVGSQSISERPPSAREGSVTQVNCVLLLGGHTHKSLLRIPQGDRVTIKGRLKRVGVPTEIEVDTVRSRKSKRTANQTA